MARFGGGGFRSKIAAEISSNGDVESARIVKSGESQRLFAIGSSYRKINASNISRLYGMVELSMAFSSIRSSSFRCSLNSHALFADIAQ